MRQSIILNKQLSILYMHMHIEQLHRFKLMFSIVLNDRLFSPLMSMFIMFFSRIVNCLFSALVLLIFKFNRENVIISIAIRLTQKLETLLFVGSKLLSNRI